MSIIVREDEDTVSSMGSADSRSRNKHRLDGVSKVLKVTADSFDGEGLVKFVSVKFVTLREQRGFASHVNKYPSFHHSGDSSNILTDNPSGPDFVNNAEHLRPEITVIVSSSPLSGVGKRLTWESSGEDIDLASPFFETCFCDVFIGFRFGKPVVQDGATEGVDFAMERVNPPHHLRGHLRPANSTK